MMSINNSCLLNDIGFYNYRTYDNPCFRKNRKRKTEITGRHNGLVQTNDRETCRGYFMPFFSFLI